MQTWGRRLRGALGMGLTWAATWAGAGIVMATATAFDADAPFPLSQYLYIWHTLSFCWRHPRRFAKMTARSIVNVLAGSGS